MPSLLIYHTQIHLKSTVVPTLAPILVFILINFLLVTLPPDVCLLIAITSEMILASTQFSSVGMLKDSKYIVEEDAFSGKVIIILASVVI